ncbi:hypothetical protein ILUMI_11743 [Ignelater luminosus]|uniref:Uncharacterized protein n=1 Tax=Ignelater luminosus TaxID=2038154 RepID=A0A8K0GCZ1_IGNLU|nr:hypothetical protein ILUMI_11743 [Ignelater luminosus]
MSAQLTKEQEAFLDECLLEFSDRYTDADIEYKKVYDTGIPPPPIMYPWYGRPRLGGNRDRDRDRTGGSYRSGYREHRYENNYRDRDQHRENDRDRRYQDHRRFRPY